MTRGMLLGIAIGLGGCGLDDDASIGRAELPLEVASVEEPSVEEVSQQLADGELAFEDLYDFVTTAEEEELEPMFELEMSSGPPAKVPVTLPCTLSLLAYGSNVTSSCSGRWVTCEERVNCITWYTAPSGCSGSCPGLSSSYTTTAPTHVASAYCRGISESWCEKLCNFDKAVGLNLALCEAALTRDYGIALERGGAMSASCTSQAPPPPTVTCE